MAAARRSTLPTLVRLLAAAAAAALFVSCGPEQEDPRVFGELATVKAASPAPTPRPDAPTPTPIPAAQMAREAQERSDAALDPTYNPTEGTIRVGVWDDKRALLNSYLAAYIIVYGFDYSVEMVETTEEEYPAMLESGELDIVFQTAPALAEWLSDRSESGSVLNAGAFTAAEDVRIAANGRLAARAPQIVEFLESIAPDDVALDAIAARITGGRTAVNPNVAALIFLKNHEELWTRWAHQEVVDKVKAAIEAGKTDLKNRKYIPDPGSA